ncbi:VOC family protein [Methylopila sp. 73B]|uniref:VOC family protein n=1 Tax=Methylopila sp. 73B TaxID=1120792 RepID=UPI000367D5CD|nr:VOC family protein [Methylopila sp. 73B]
MTVPTSSTIERSSVDPVLATAPHRISKVTLVVRDLDRVAGFYQDVIGLRETGREAGVLRLGTEAATLVELRHDPSVQVSSPRDAGLFHTAFLLPERADLAAWLSFAAQRRVPIQGASDHLVSEAIYLADPEGNGIEVYADRPSAEWVWDRGAVRMSTDALDAQSLLSAAEGEEWRGFPQGGKVGHVHLQVGAIAPAEAFYGSVLGFDVTARYPGGSFFGSGGYHHQLAANIWNSRGARPRTERTTGLADVEIAVDCDTIEAIRSRATGQPEGGDGTRFTLRDPWNTSITLTSPETGT